MKKDIVRSKTTQTPFTTVGFGTETTYEGRLIQSKFLKIRSSGFGKNKDSVVVFPKIVYAIHEELNLNEDSPNHDIYKQALECMTKSIYPDLLFITKEDWLNKTVTYPMGCRAFLSPWIDPKTGLNKVKARNNAGAITVNLVRIAIKNKLNPQGFYKELERVMELCKENSIFRMNYLKDTKASSAPILWQSGALAELQPNETVGQFLFNGYTTISIGFIGLSEVSQLLFGKDFSQDDEVYKECIKIMEFMKSKVDEYKKETGIGFALYATPSESLMHKFAVKDTADFGIIEGITDKGYYDNSFHVSSRLEISPFDKLKLEAPFHHIATGGQLAS